MNAGGTAGGDVFKSYISPLDYSYPLPLPVTPGYVKNSSTSYLTGSVGGNLDSYTDGLSNTIFYAESLSNCTGESIITRNGLTGYAITTYQRLWNYDPILSYSSSFIVKPSSSTSFSIGIYPSSGYMNGGYTTPPFEIRPPAIKVGSSTVSGYGSCLNSNQALSSAGLLVALGDGSVRILSPSISPTTFNAALTKSGGEVLGSDW